MIDKLAIDLPYTALAQFCEKWGITELSIFGSILRDDFDPVRSDIDLLFKLAEGRKHRLEELIMMQEALESLLDRPIDLIPKKVIQNDSNYLRRQLILGSVQVIYAV